MIGRGKKDAVLPRHAVQTQLNVGPVDDPFEREAERTALEIGEEAGDVSHGRWRAARSRGGTRALDISNRGTSLEWAEKMTISLAPKHLARYKELAGLFLKYGHGDLANDLRSKGDLPELPEETAHASPKAEELAADLERLGPTFVKLGQLFSARSSTMGARSR